LKIFSCIQLDPSYRALTFDVLVQQLSTLTTIYRSIELFRKPLTERLESSPYMDTT